ncbi:MAG: hypothetical protein R2695_04105 [Acidimicrobiales bacterium]
MLGAMTEMQVISLGLRSGMLDHGEGRAMLGRDPIPGRDSPRPHLAADGQPVDLAVAVDESGAAWRPARRH